MATTAELIAYYQGLLIIQYIGKLKAKATIGASVEPIIMDQLPLQVQDAFTIGTAVGAQLNVLGKYAGVTRSGFGSGQRAITLSDADYTQFIKLAIVRNNFGSSLAEIQDLLHRFFPDEIFVFDHLGMRMSYYLVDTVGSQDLAELFISKGLLPRPMGVQLSVVIYGPPEVLTAFFGFRTYEAAGYNNSPFNDYDNYETDRPWLSYDNALVI